MTRYLRRLYEFFIRRSDTQKLAMGFGAIAFIAALGIGIFSATTLASLSNPTPPYPPTTGDLYAAELLLHETEAYPDEVIYVMSDPGNPDQPVRYFLLRSYVETPETDIATLHYTEAEQ
jgi:hypothetical protein